MRVKQTKKTFDPSKNYSWKPEDEFVLNGVQFSRLYQQFKLLAEQQDYKLSPMSIVISYNDLQSLLEKGIEEGIIKEQVPDAPKEKVKEPEY